MQTIDVKGIPLSVEVRGAGPAIVLVHGYPLDHTMWRHQIDALSASYQVIAPDLRGFGQSQVSPGAVTMQRFADDLAAILDALTVREPVTLCGLSMGGYIAFGFALGHSHRLAKLVLCDTKSAADTPEAAQTRRDTAQKVLAEGSQAIVDGMVPKLFAPSTIEHQPDVVAATRKVMLGTKPEGIAAALRGMAERPDVTSELSRIRVPTLVVCGEHDVITPLEEMRRMAERLPQGTFISIPDAGHLAPLEKPADVNAALLAFLA